MPTSQQIADAQVANLLRSQGFRQHADGSWWSLAQELNEAERLRREAAFVLPPSLPRGPYVVDNFPPVLPPSTVIPSVPQPTPAVNSPAPTIAEQVASLISLSPGGAMPSAPLQYFAAPPSSYPPSGESSQNTEYAKEENDGSAEAGLQGTNGKVPCDEGESWRRNLDAKGRAKGRAKKRRKKAVRK